MLRYRSCTIALVVMLGGLSPAEAADNVLTLACRGTASAGKGEPEATSLGMVVNFTTGTVKGLVDFPAAITSVDEVTISFSGSRPYGSVSGSIDRVTGDAEATSFLHNTKTVDVLLMISYALKCRPAQRMF
jgi:hypothetical protein